METAPWWFVGVVSLLSALIGAGASLGATGIAEWRRSKETRHERWRADRRMAHRTYLVMINTRHIDFMEDLDAGRDPGARVIGDQSLLDRQDEVFADIMMMATPQGATAAFAWHSSLVLAREAHQAGKPIEPYKKVMLEARARYVTAMQRELGTIR